MPRWRFCSRTYVRNLPNMTCNSKVIPVLVVQHHHENVLLRPHAFGATISYAPTLIIGKIASNKISVQLYKLYHTYSHHILSHGVCHK
jgi:hypothetical protein